MTTHDNEWEQTAFGAEGSGFRPDQTSADSQGTVQHHPPPPPPPPSKPDRARKRSALYWFGMLAAGVLVVSVIGGVTYWLTRPSVEEEAFIAGNLESEADDSSHSASAQPEQEVTQLKGSAQHEQDALNALFGDSTMSANQTQSEGKHEERYAPVEHTNPAVSKNPVPPASTSQSQDAATSTPTKSKVVAKTPRTESIASASKPEPPTKSRRQQPPAEKPKVTAAKGQPLFVVQVFSSPSKDDANEWLQSLRDRNVSGGYIVEQRIKGEPWYRVRFGEFGTRDAAESEALRLGFREPWIARVR